MKKALYIILSICFLSCSESKEEQIKHLNGYWEIVEATSESHTKTYKYNEFIDFIELNDSLKGFRKKLKPTFEGIYLKTNIKENLTVKVENNTINLYYKTAFTNRKEEVLKLTAEELKVKNENNQTYLYKRYQPLDLD